MENLLYDLNGRPFCTKDKDALVFIIKNYAFQLSIQQILIEYLIMCQALQNRRQILNLIKQTNSSAFWCFEPHLRLIIQKQHFKTSNLLTCLSCPFPQICLLFYPPHSFCNLDIKKNPSENAFSLDFHCHWAMVLSPFPREFLVTSFLLIHMVSYSSENMLMLV